MTIKTIWPKQTEVLLDIARTMGEHRMDRDVDRRDDFELFCQWADEYQVWFEATPDAAETYYESIETFTLDKALDSGFISHKPQEA